MKHSGVYVLENATRQRYYIGSSKNINARLSQHFSKLRNNKHEIAEMQNDYNNGDVFKSHIEKDLVSDYQSFLFDEEGKTIREYRDKGLYLYNTQYIDGSRFISEINLEEAILNAYCKEKYGKTYRQLTAHAHGAEIEMLYYLIKEPEREKELKYKYQPIIDYQNKCFYKSTH